MRHKISSYELLKQMLAEVASDDLSLPWNTYPCLEWPRFRTKKGYGAIHDKDNDLVHRLALAAVRGPLVGDMCALHRCDNPPCFRPAHLFRGTRLDNARDAGAKGRMGKKNQNGTRNSMAKLTEGQVLDIRRLRTEHWSVIFLARHYGVSRSLICLIERRQIWKHI